MPVDIKIWDTNWPPIRVTGDSSGHPSISSGCPRCVVSGAKQQGGRGHQKVWLHPLYGLDKLMKGRIKIHLHSKQERRFSKSGTCLSPPLNWFITFLLCGTDLYQEVTSHLLSSLLISCWHIFLAPLQFSIPPQPEGLLQSATLG